MTKEELFYEMAMEESRNAHKTERESSRSQIDSIVTNLSELNDKAYCLYAFKVDEFIHKTGVSKNEAEHLLDGLLDFCTDKRFVRLFKKVCRHILPIYPETASYYVHTYKELYSEE